MIIGIVLVIIITIIGFIFMEMSIHEEEYEFLILIIFATIGLNALILSPFVALDKSSGTTIGTITAVDKDFFGTTTLYIKTTENKDEYCMEDDTIINQAKELVGKKVQLYYGERVGIYPLNKCRKAPIDKIEKIEGKDNE